MEAGKRNISDIFNPGRALEIPFFQRAYVWEEENWDRLLEDMKRIAVEKRPYFLGSVILKQMPTDSGCRIGDTRAVIDGQQRLTTIVLFFKVLFETLGDSDGFQRHFHNSARELCLRHNHTDVEVFEAIASDGLTDELRARHKDNRVLQAYDFFRSQRDTISGLDLPTLLSRVYFVGIDLNSDEDEQQIFDTINSLGVSLSTAELLKNELFRRSDLELYERTWRPTFEQDGETRAYWETKITAGRSRRENIDLMLQAFLLISSNAREDLAGVDDLFRSYKAFLGGVADKAGFVMDLKRCAETHRDAIRPGLLSEDIDQGDPVQRLNVLLLGLNTTTVVPYLLYVLHEVQDGRERAEMLRLIESFVVRRTVCRETSKNYNQLFASLIRNQVKTHAGLLERFSGSGDPTSRIPSDAAFETGFAESHLTNQQARVVLYLLEQSTRDDSRYNTGLRGLERYSLEHIMPRKWRNHWGTVDAGRAERRDEHLLRLGNLTLLSTILNTAIRDSAWADKKEGRGKHGGLLKYGTGLNIFDEDLKKDEWTVDDMIARGRRLCAQAREVWRIPAAADD